MSLYCAVVGFTIPFHEPWADEAQAWLIARDSTAWDILRHRLHYEGAPPLWHLILHLFYVMGGSYAGINWLGGAFATAAVFVLLRWSPFPLILRVLLPFTYFLLYQYVVIARGYTLFALLVFSLCALFPHKERAVAFAIVAGLLANLTMQGAIFATLAVLLFGWEHLGRSFRRARPKWRPYRQVAFVFLPFLLFACVMALPAPDDNFYAITKGVSTGPVHEALVQLIGQPTPRLPFLPQPFTPDPSKPKTSFLQSPGDWAAWYTTCDEHESACAAGLTYTKPYITYLVNLANQATWPISTSKVLAMFFLAATLLWLRMVRGLRFILPAATLLLLGQLVWSVDHHSGMFVITLLAAIWLARVCRPEPGTDSRLQKAYLILLTAVMVLQVGWSIFCLRADVLGPYDPGKAAAAYLKANPVPRTAAFQYFSSSVQPYFERSPFFNLPTAYWRWSSVDNSDAHFRETIATRPERVVLSVDLPKAGMMENEWAPLIYLWSPAEESSLSRNLIAQELHSQGYMETRRFCGSRFMRLGVSMGVCDVIFEPAKSSVR